MENKTEEVHLFRNIVDNGNVFISRVDRGFDSSNLSQAEIIGGNKRMSKTMKDVRKSLMTGTCFCCGKTVSSYCNSHNIPRYCLENIGVDGEVCGMNAILKLPEMGLSIGKETPGINESGTFQLICRDCDNTLFQDYENPDNYIEGKTPTDKMLAQIAMKNYLRFIFKRRTEITMEESALQMVEEKDNVNPFLLEELMEKERVGKLDLDSYKNSFSKAKRYAETGKGNGYYLLYYRLLNYVVPLAMQAPLVLAIDLAGNVINDILNMDPIYDPTEIHVCVFPQKNTTAILMFTDFGDRTYSRFMRQFMKLDEESRLGVINYIIFLYSEDYFLSKELQSKIDLSLLKEIVNLTFTIWSRTPIDTHVLSDRYALNKWNSIPNLLSENYKLR